MMVQSFWNDSKVVRGDSSLLVDSGCLSIYGKFRSVHRYRVHIICKNVEYIKVKYVL